MGNARQDRFWPEPDEAIQMNRQPAGGPSSSRLAWRLALLATLVLTVSVLFLQALVFTTRGALPETAKKNTVRPFSVYLPTATGEDHPGLQPRGVESIRKALNQALLEQQVQIVDAYAGFSTQTLTRGSNSLNVPLTGISGASFAAFRHMELLSGNFLMADAFSTRSIVLDELAAWQLFGATDIAGFTVKIQDKTLTVSGVVRLPDNWQSQLSRADQAHAFIPYATLSELDPKLSITAYEVRLPEPVSGMGLQFLRDALSSAGIPPDTIELVDHDARLGLVTLLTSWRTVGSRVVRDSAVVLPWWENAARAAIDLASLLSQLAGAALLVLVFCLYSLRDVPAIRKRQLSSRLGLAALAGLAAAHFFIQTRGEWVPSGKDWLASILATLALPQLIYLSTIGWTALRRTFPDTRSVWTRLQPVGESLLRIIKQLRKRKPAKEETPI
ncbi:MAG: ABC transporter permease [Eubacteriales bacterium]|nr:ABC transporter permease [Eubacteriales bacterium]